MEDALDELRVSPEPAIEVPEAINGYSAINEDFRYVHEKLLNLRKRTQDLNLLGSGLHDMLKREGSLPHELWSRREGRTMIALMFVGVVFIPLVFIAELFSMGQDFGPAASYFWVYWIVAIPTSCFVLMGAWFFVRRARI